MFVALSVAASLQATTLPELFNALKNHAQTKADAMNVEKAKIKVTANKNVVSFLIFISSFLFLIVINLS